MLTLDPLKSYRCAISFCAWLIALSTSWRSTPVVMSNELVWAMTGLETVSTANYELRTYCSRRFLRGSQLQFAVHGSQFAVGSSRFVVGFRGPAAAPPWRPRS